MSSVATCPICSGQRFGKQGTRSTARCLRCSSLERGRHAWLVMRKLGLLTPGTKILNVAPEQFMLEEGLRIFGAENYFGCDYDPSQYERFSYPVKKIDLCGDLGELGGISFGVIMHNHVLEHVPCSVSDVLRKLNSVLQPGGLHLFSVPISPRSVTREDLNPALSGNDRLLRFGQADHMRVFGGQDFIAKNVPAEMHGFIDLSTLLTQGELATHGIPAEALSEFNSHHIFAWRKPTAGAR